MNETYKYPENYLLFNSPLEVGLRILVLLSQDSTTIFDIDRLVIFDYFILHANDVDNEQKNLHPSLPLRSSEIIIRRKLISEGLDLLVSKGLVEKVYTDKGIYYRANKLTSMFIDLLKSDYYKDLNSLCYWVTNKFKSFTTPELNSIVNENIQLWGGEFEFESLVRGNYE